MPSKMERLLDMLGVNPQARSFQHAMTPDIDYGEPSVKIGKGYEGVLFPYLTFDQ